MSISSYIDCSTLTTSSLELDQDKSHSRTWLVHFLRI